MTTYDLLTELTETELQMMDEFIENEAITDADRLWNDTLMRQKQMVSEKIHDGNFTKRNYRKKAKKVFIVLAAAVMTLLGTVSVAMEKYDLDIHMAETLGLSGVMPLLPDGSIYIGVSDTDAGVILTATEAIGDKFNQWIKIETNIPWKEGKEYYFDHTWNHAYKTDSIAENGGYVIYCYEDEGMVAFMQNFVQYDAINRSHIELELGKLMECNAYSDDPDYEQEESVYADGTWNLSWDNYYAANTKVKYPMKLITSENSKGDKLKVLVYHVEISPVSIQLNALALDSERRADTKTLTIESLILKDGTVICCENTGGGGCKNGLLLDKYLSFYEVGLKNLSEVEAITIGGERIKLSLD